LRFAALPLFDAAKGVGFSGQDGSARRSVAAEQAKKVAGEALKAGGDPGMAKKILLSALAEEEGGVVLEKRLVALLDAVPRNEARARLAKMAWGKRTEAQTPEGDALL